MRLVELFTTERELRWENDGEFSVARFKTDDGRAYRINFYPEPLKSLKYTARNMPDVMAILKQISEDAKMVRVEFSLQTPVGGYYDTKYGKTGTGNQYAVFSTVIDAIKEFTQKHGYDHVRIVAEEPSRQTLYRRMIKMMPHKRVWESQDPMDGQVAFIVEL